ncbi:MAG TPA: glycosyltransferase [Clostridiales bacterium]|nr:glycosyltransferase [Clostridiales bacterium]
MNRITLCMIVKNEETTLESCLSGIAPFVDEIIIIDTGSIDRTKEIALNFTDKVYDYAWANDFAAARNYSISKATNEYILVLDSDEVVEQINIGSIKLSLEQHPKKIGRLLRINEFTREGISHKYIERVNRLFSKKHYHYEGIIHEQLVPAIATKPNATEYNTTEPKSANTPQHSETVLNEDNTYHIPLTVRHSGYEGDLAQRKKKTERNISLLKNALQQHPNDPYLLYQLGKSYYMEEDYANAREFFGQALYADLDPRLEYVQDMVESYGYSLINTEQYETALQLLNIYDEFSHSADFIFLIALILMNNGRFQEAIQEFQKAAKKPECKMEGVNSYLAFYNIGVIYECLGDLENAKKSYKNCKNYEAAAMRLSKI